MHSKSILSSRRTSRSFIEFTGVDGRRPLPISCETSVSSFGRLFQSVLGVRKDKRNINWSIYSVVLQMPEEMDEKVVTDRKIEVGHRILSEEQYGTIRFVGLVPPTQGECARISVFVMWFYLTIYLIYSPNC